jgi:DNA mismatch repair protein MutS2
MSNPFPTSALDSLEFAAVLAWISEGVGTTAGAKKLHALRPGQGEEVVQARRRRGQEAQTCLAEKISPGLARCGDMERVLERTRAGAALGEEFLQIAETFELAAELASTFAKRNDSALGAGFQGLKFPIPMAIRIRECLDGDGQVRDQADPALAKLRAEISQGVERRRKRMEALAEEMDAKGALRQRTVVQRADRLVLAVKTTQAGRVRGVVHDRSQSGDTIFIEPADVVEISNHLVTLRSQERQRVEAILAALGRKVLAKEDLVLAVESSIAEVDVAFASAFWAEVVGGRWIPRQGQVMELREARHPLLVRQEGMVVPLNLELGQTYDLLVVTGPNTGGKTVVLKTLGLLAALSESGLPITAAEGSTCPVWTGLDADIGDSQSLETSLSTFSGHLKRIVRILNHAPAGGLVLLDELGTGTDPEEGAALGQAVLEALLAKGVKAVANTHLGQLKLFSVGVKRAENASMEFDPQSLAPSFRLLVGVPGASHAVEVAELLGLPENILERARELAGRGDGAEEWLAEVGQVRRNAEELRERAVQREADSRDQLRLTQTRDEDSRHRASIREGEAEQAFREHCSALEALMAQGEQSVLPGLKGQNRQIAEALFADIRRLVGTSDLGSRWSEFVRTLKKGQLCWVPKLRGYGRITKVNRKKERVLLRVGELELELAMRELSWLEPPPLQP